MKFTFTQPLLAIIALAGHFSLCAQDNKILSFTVAPEDAGKSITVQLGVTANQTVKIDWGNKTLSDPINLTTANDPYNSLTGTIAGTEIVIYGEDPATIKRLKQSGEDGPKLTSIDLSSLSAVTDLNISNTSISVLDISACSALKNLEAQCNAITKLTLPSSESLTTIDVSNEVDKDNGTILKGSNAALGSDWGVLPQLTKLNLSGNLLADDETFDISNNAELDELTIHCCNLKEINIANNLKFRRLLAYHNQFTSLDASTMIAKSTIQASHNRLESIKIPAGMSTLHLEDNCLTFATLPVKPTTSAALYKYANQSPVKAVVNGGKIDLSAQAMVGETATVFSWKDGETELLEGTDYTVSNGIFTFLKNAGKAICTMKNSALSKLTLTTVELNIDLAGIESVEADADAPVEYYDLRGIRVNGDTPGIYIRRQGNKTTKIIVK